MIVLFTDFGYQGPYLGQMHAAIAQRSPSTRVIDLIHDAPQYKPQAAAHLLAAYAQGFPEGTIFLCVVDPGVGTETRQPVILQADACWYVGPGNGLFDVLSGRAQQSRWYQIDWRPKQLSHSFHGRDLFAPIAAKLAMGEPINHYANPMSITSKHCSDDFFEVIYFDAFGNAITGIRSKTLNDNHHLCIKDQTLRHARTFGDVAVGQTFWYRNANQLIEIATNQANTQHRLALQIGDKITLSTDASH